MTLTFYTVKDDFRKVNKTLTGETALNVDIRTDVDIYNPVFMIRNFDTNYNYLSWDNRYYFITGYEYIGKNVWQLSTDIDVLMTYKDTILNSIVKIESGTAINDYFNGGDYESLVTYETDRYYSDTTLSDTQTTVLVTIGNKGV